MGVCLLLRISTRSAFHRLRLGEVSLELERQAVDVEVAVAEVHPADRRLEAVAVEPERAEVTLCAKRLPGVVVVARAVRRQLALLMPRRAGVARAPRGEFAAGIVGLRTELRRAKERPVSVGIDVQDAEVVVVPAHDACVDVPPLATGPARDVPCYW